MVSVRKGAAPLKCFRRIVTLSQIPDAEKWLCQMAMRGLLLDHICGCKFYFKQSAKECVHYFLLNGDIGANSEDWVFYEFLQMGGQRIPFEGSCLLSPRLALSIDMGTHQDKENLYRYYYRYRNYRTLHRFFRNILVCAFGAFLSGLLCALQAVGLWFFLQYGGICLLLCLYQVFSVLHFVHSCKRQGQPCHWKKPRRPGYGSEGTA